MSAPRKKTRGKGSAKKDATQTPKSKLDEPTAENASPSEAGGVDGFDPDAEPYAAARSGGTDPWAAARADGEGERESASASGPLLPHHIELLRQRAVSVEVATLARLRSVDATGAGEMLGWNGPALGPALAIPYPGISPPYHRIRFDDGEIRYLCPSKREVPVYIPPSIPAAPTLRGELSEAFIVVEAPIKALALRSIGLNAVGLGGTGTTLQKEKHRLNSSWDPLDLEDRRVVIAFDANRRTNPNVARDEARLVEALQQAGARVRVADLPEGPRGREEWGPDDFLAGTKNGADRLFEILSQAVEGDPLDRIASLAKLDDALDGAERLLDDGPFLAAVLHRGEAVRSTAARRIAEIGVSKQAFGRALSKYEKASKRRDEEDAAAPERAENPYSIIEGRFFFVDTSVPYAICNFTAAIKEDLTVDDGSDVEVRQFLVEGETADKRKLPPITVPAEEFSAASAHWPSVRWGHDTIVHADCQQHIRPAIMYHSQSVTRRRELAHTGFRVIDGRLVYLTQSGAIGAAVNAQVRLDSTMARYALPAVPATREQLVEGIHAILRLPLVAPDRVAIPLIGVGFRAPLCHWLACDCVVWMWGPTGSLKSTLVALPLSFFGEGFDREHLTATWGDTVTSLETKCFRAKDAVIVLDDFAPKDHDRDEQRRKADWLIRNLGNGASRSRMNGDMRARPDRPPRGVVISTGEDLPSTQSIIARLFPLALCREDVNLQALSEVQRQAALFPGVMRAYVEQVIAWAAADPGFAGTLRKRFEDLRSSFSSSGHLRAPAAAANIALGWRAFLSFASGFGALSRDEAEQLKVRGDDALRAQLEVQQAVSTQDEPVERFLRYLRDMLTSGRARLSEGDEPLTQLPGSETIGWRLGDGKAHLLPEPAFGAVVRAMTDARESFPIRSGTLWSRLVEKGLAQASREKNRHTVQRRHDGVVHRVVELLPHALNPDGDGDDDSPGGGASPPAAPGVPTERQGEKSAQQAVTQAESGAVPGVTGDAGVEPHSREESSVGATGVDTRKNAAVGGTTSRGPGTPGTRRDGDQESVCVTGSSTASGPSPAPSPPTVTPGTLVTDPDALPEVARAIVAVGVVALDLETTGLDPRRDRPRLLQLGFQDGRVVVVDLFSTGGLGPLAQALGHVEVAGHNLAFDLGFLAHHFGVTPRGWDTQLASQLIDGGTNLHTKGFHKLGAVVERFLGVKLDKSLQTSDWSGPLSDKQIAYAASDVAHLLRLRRALEARLADRSLTTVIRIENELLPVIMGMELAGVPVDVAALNALAEERERMSAEARERVCAALGIDNPNSQKQLIAALKAVGINVAASNAEALAPYRDHPVVRELATTRTCKKVADDARSLADVARGQADGRVRPNWWQIGAPTGRMATSSPNMLGLPKVTAMRACIAAPPGRTFVIADYAAIELRVLAHVTGDKRLTAIFRAGGDPHRSLASILLQKEPADVTADERKRAKPVNFGFAFGMGPDRFVGYALKDYGVVFVPEEARRFKGSYLAAYRQVDEWQRKTRARMDREALTVAGRVRDFANSRDGYTERLNMPVQGTAADGMKRAMAILAPRLAKLDARIILAVHDELVVETPAAVADEVKATVERGMIEGMAVDVSSVPIVVEAEVHRTWGKR